MFKKSNGFAGVFIKERAQSREINEAYFSSGLINLLKDGAKAGWLRGMGSFAKGLRMKSTSGVDRSFVKGDYYIMDSDIGNVGSSSNFGRLATILDELRKLYGAMHNHRYKTIQDLNFEDVVMFDEQEVQQAIGSKKNFSSPYNGLKVYSKVVKADENKYAVEFGVEMIK